MDGILNVLKPSGMTSFDVVAILRGLTGTRKIGHAGTLDPLAAGVLPICAGRATKAIEFLMNKDKEYRGELTLGIETDTQDSLGQIIESTKPVCTDKEIEDAVNSFKGSYMQMPPMHSALKIDGKRLYDLARAGIEVERQKRKVIIHSIKVHNIDRTEGVKVIFDVHCSKGTYIRTLCADIGERLGCGGHMSFLLRQRAGPFNISEAFTLETLSKMREDGKLHQAFLGVESIFNKLPSIKLKSNTEKRFKNGAEVPVCIENAFYSNIDKESLYSVYDAEDVFIALGLIKQRDNKLYLKVKKFF